MGGMDEMYGPNLWYTFDAWRADNMPDLARPIIQICSFIGMILVVAWTQVYQIRGGYSPIIDVWKVVLDFRRIDSLRNHSASTATAVENRGQITDFITSCEIRERKDEISEGHFQTVIPPNLW